MDEDRRTQGIGGRWWRGRGAQRQSRRSSVAQPVGLTARGRRGRGRPSGVSGAVGGDWEAAKWQRINNNGSDDIELDGNGYRVLKRGTGGGIGSGEGREGWWFLL
jgi:hypothetical protein